MHGGCNQEDSVRQKMLFTCLKNGQILCLGDSSMSYNVAIY